MKSATHFKKELVGNAEILMLNFHRCGNLKRNFSIGLKCPIYNQGFEQFKMNHMNENKLPIGNGINVIVTDQNGNKREGKVFNQDNGKYLIRFQGTSMGEFWSPEFVKEK
jgi:hypothetical protein